MSLHRFAKKGVIADTIDKYKAGEQPERNADIETEQLVLINSSLILWCLRSTGCTTGLMRLGLHCTSCVRVW